MDPNLLRELVSALATSRPQNTLPAVTLPRNAPMRYQEPKPKGIFARLFGDPYSNLIAEHQYRRFRNVVEAETEEYCRDITQAQDLRQIKREAQKNAYQYQSQLWVEIEKLKATGFAELTGISALNELIGTMETMGLAPHQQMTVVRRLHALFSMPLDHKDPEDELST